MKLHLYSIFSLCLFATGVSAQNTMPTPKPSTTVIKGESDRPAPPMPKSAPVVNDEDPPPPPPPKPKPPPANAGVVKGVLVNPAPPPPPPPLIYSAPDKSLVVKFSSDEFGFTIDFPGKPEVSATNFDGADINTFKVRLRGSDEIVEIFDYGFNVERSLGKDGIFKQIKQKYLSGELSKLVYEKEIEQDGLVGKEFGFNLSYEFFRVRAFVSNSRIYEISSTVTNWHILENGEKEKTKEFNDETDRLFASFKIEKTAPAVNADKNTAERAELFKSKKNIYEAEDGSFRVYFPGKPTAVKNRVMGGFGETDINLVTFPSRMAFYGVSYFDYPTVVTDVSEIRFISDEQRDMLMKKNFTLVSEKDISYKGNYGREYVLTNDGSTLVMRNFFAKQRFFRLLVITNGVKGKIPAQFAEQYETVTYRFLDSLEIDKIPPPEFAEVKMPEDFGLKTENSTVSSDYFGFSMNLPENWKLLNAEQTGMLKQFGFLAIENQNEIVKSWTEKSLENTEFLFASIDEGDQKDKVKSSIIIAAEKLTTPRFLPEAVSALYIREMLEENEEVVGGINKLKIDGVDFAWFETLDKNTKERQRIYFSNLKNLAFMILFTYRTDDELKMFADKLNSIKFKK